MKRFSFAIILAVFAMSLHAGPACAQDSGDAEIIGKKSGGGEHGGGEDGDKKKEGGGLFAGKSEPTYVKIAPFVIPVIGSNGPEEIVSMIITLEVDSYEKADFIRTRLPKLNDAYMQALYGALDRGVVKKNGLVDVAQIKGRLVTATAKVFGEGYVDDVLIQALAQRRLQQYTTTPN